MATQEQCEAALTQFARRLSGAQGTASAKLEDRTLSCALTDLRLLYIGRLHGGELSDVRLAGDGENPAPAQIRLSLVSDDLVALSRGELDLAKAWLKGQVKLEASFADLLRLRSML